MGTARTCIFVITIHLIHAVTAQDKRLGFVGMRGKKFLDQDDLRSPQFPYNGGRGKKSMFDIENEEKRAPMGFIGTRGKKPFPMNTFYPEDFNRGGSLIGEIDYSPDDSYENNNRLYDLLTQYQMRLQSDVGPSSPESAEYDNEINKRAANMHQFYGVRGKKAEGKGPYGVNFNGKFIAVRGKKELKNNAQEIKFLLGQNGPWPKRKAQMGFFGMRGKKWTDESSQENENPN